MYSCKSQSTCAEMSAATVRPRNHGTICLRTCSSCPESMYNILIVYVSKPTCMGICTHTCKYAYVHIYIYVYVCVYLHTCVQTHRAVYMSVGVYMHIPTSYACLEPGDHIHLHIHTPIHIHIYMYKHVYAHVFVCIYTHVCMHVCILIYVICSFTYSFCHMI